MTSPGYGPSEESTPAPATPIVPTAAAAQPAALSTTLSPEPSAGRPEQPAYSAAPPLARTSAATSPLTVKRSIVAAGAAWGVAILVAVGTIAAAIGIGTAVEGGSFPNPGILLLGGFLALVLTPTGAIITVSRITGDRGGASQFRAGFIALSILYALVAVGRAVFFFLPYPGSLVSTLLLLGIVWALPAWGARVIRWPVALGTIGASLLLSVTFTIAHF